MQAKMEQCKEQTGHVARLSDDKTCVLTKYGKNLTEGRTIAGHSPTPTGRGKENKTCVCSLKIGSKLLFSESKTSGNSTLCSTCGWIVSTSVPSRTTNNKPSPTMSVAWGYGHNNGPLQWYKSYSIAKEGKRQSPIDIQTKDARYDQTLADKPIMTTYKSETGMELENNGHSVKAQMKEKSEVSGGPLEGTYYLEQFHLHWGANDGEGSEHTIDKKTYAAELHLVHYNSKYKTFAQAADKEDGLAVFGFMVKVGKSHKGFEKISKDLGNLCEKGTKCNMGDKFDPSCLLSDLSSYWTYAGSLTTPPLFESVTWIVFKEPLEISEEQMVSLRLLRDSEGSNIVNNYRPPLEVGDRVVRSSFR